MQVYTEAVTSTQYDLITNFYNTKYISGYNTLT